MKVDIGNLSYQTLVGIVGDLNITNTQLNNENKRLTTDLAKKQERAQHSEGDSEWHFREQGKRNVSQVIIDGTTELTDTQTIMVLGLVYEAGQKIIAIKAHQKLFGTSLKESKKSIEQWRNNLPS